MAKIASLKGVNLARGGLSVRLVADAASIEDVRRSLQRLERRGQENAKASMVEIAKKIVRVAKTLVPVDPEDGGDLRDSIRHTRGTISRSGRITVTVLAGGDVLKKSLGGRKYNIYAILQHEDLTLRHTVGGPKFLERPVFAHAPEIPVAVMAGLDEVANG